MCKCNKNTSPSSLPPPPPSSPSDTPQIKSIMKNNSKKQSTGSNSCHKPKPPRRRNRTKTRKPKYLSLRLQLSKSKPNQQQQQKQQQQQPQLNLFPLHPENQNDDFEDKDLQEDQNDVVLLFSSDPGASSSLNGLLDEADSTTNTTGVTTTSEEDSFSPPHSMTCPIGGDNGSNWLVRKAMRRRDGDDGSEEIRWVCYSEVVEKKELMEEVTSFSTSAGGGGWFDGVNSRMASFGSLSLKLDYEGILNAWSDKGSFYVAGEAPQTVPDLVDDVFSHNHVAWHGCDSNDVGNTWKVPEGYCGAKKMMKVKEENQEMVGKVGHREASVLRYKEKRQSRLFSKRIRYEVRKLNAEKRPRMKGRFVKRD